MKMKNRKIVYRYTEFIETYKKKENIPINSHRIVILLNNNNNNKDDDDDCDDVK